jgi:hypothetical protein
MDILVVYINVIAVKGIRMSPWPRGHCSEFRSTYVRISGLGFSLFFSDIYVHHMIGAVWKGRVDIISAELL